MPNETSLQDALAMESATAAPMTVTRDCPSPERCAAPTACFLGTATLLTMLPVTLLVPVLKELLADRFDASVFWAHSFMSINMIGAIVALPMIAGVVDRAASRRRVIATALLLDAALLMGMSAAPSLGALLALRALEGAAHMLALSALMAAAADLAAPNRRGRMMGVVGSSMMLGTAAGARLGGLIWQTWPGLTFEIAAGIAGLAALFAVLALPDAPRRTVVTRLSEAISLVRRHRRLAAPYAYTFIDRFCVGFVISTFVLFLASAHGLDPDGRSRMLAMFLGPFALLVYPVGRLVDRIGAVWPLVCGSMLFGLLFASYGFIPIAWMPAAMVASGVFSAMMFAPTLSMCAELSPPNQRGAAYAGFNAAGSLGFICGPLIGGLLGELLGGSLGVTGAHRAAFVVGGVAEFTCALATLPLLLRLQRAGLCGSRPRTESDADRRPAAAAASGPRVRVPLSSSASSKYRVCIPVRRG